MRTIPVAIVPLAILALAALSGCSAIVDAVHSESETHYDDRAALVEASVPALGDAAWLPDDASDITLRVSTKTGVTPNAVIGFATASTSDLGGCTQTERLSLPPYAVEWGPVDTDLVAESSVLSCGEWVFVATDDGWFGWTPSAPGERVTP